MRHALRNVWSTLHHLSLSSCCSIRFRGFGERRSLHSQLLGDFAVAENLHAVGALAQHTGVKQNLRVDDCAVFKTSPERDVSTLSSGLMKMLWKPRSGCGAPEAFGRLRSRRDAAAAAGLLDL